MPISDLSGLTSDECDTIEKNFIKLLNTNYPAGLNYSPLVKAS
jgi:hypothetical protein